MLLMLFSLSFRMQTEAISDQLRDIVRMLSDLIHDVTSQKELYNNVLKNGQTILTELLTYRQHARSKLLIFENPEEYEDTTTVNSNSATDESEISGESSYEWINNGWTITLFVVMFNIGLVVSVKLNIINGGIICFFFCFSNCQEDQMGN